MTPSSSQQCADLQKVLEITRMMGATVEPDGLLQLIIDRSIELLNAERASLFLYEAETNELVSRIATGASEIRFSADTGIAGAAVKNAQVINIPDAYADERFNREIDRKTNFRTRNILAVPLYGHDCSLVGVLQVLNKTDAPNGFTEYDVSLALALGAQAGVSIQRARLIQHYVQKQNMERAMKIARDIQRRLLPAAAPSIEGFDVAGFSEPADDTGGDMFDFLALPEGKWMMVVADASGHGIGPALVIAETRAMLRAVSIQGCDVRTVLDTVNALLVADMLEGRFVTCFLGVLDPATSTLTYASAGHGPVLFYRHAEQRVVELPTTAIPLAIADDLDQSAAVSCPFAPGDFLAVTTDGFFEATDPEGNEFSIERMTELLRRDRELPAAESIANLCRAVNTFTHAQGQDDDLTALIVRRLTIVD